MSSDTRWLFTIDGLFWAPVVEAVEVFGVFFCDKSPFWEAIEAIRGTNDFSNHGNQIYIHAYLFAALWLPFVLLVWLFFQLSILPYFFEPKIVC